MVVIFGVALLLPFPRARGGDVAVPDPVADPGIAPGDERMWTARARRSALTSLPPHKLLPDRQPAYVASWVYVFGVASLAALGVAIVSGFAIAIGGRDWWHTNPVGHFFNSLHLWSVELFMALLVIHLWGKFWMAAWRGRRTLTWITGVVAFLASIVECFTGYLSQQNFDSQWIATNGKDAFNRELGPRLKAAIAASAELQERDALKSVGLAAAMTIALKARGVPDPIAHLAGEMGVLAFKRGYSEWLEADHDTPGGLAPYTAAALEDLRAASASLS